MNQTITYVLIMMVNLFSANSTETSGGDQIFIGNENQTMAANKLIYIGDPMCSWCYGFSPEISSVKEALPEGLGFELVMGGLRPNGTQTMLELKDFLKSHWMEIEEKTKQPFKYDILEQADFVYDTEPACRAVVVVKEMAPSMAFNFFKEVQKTFYLENEHTSSLNTYLKIAKDLDIDLEDFESRFNSESAKIATRRDFEYSGSLGINSFPTLIVKKGEEYHLVSRGYTKSDAILTAIDQILE